MSDTPNNGLAGRTGSSLLPCPHCGSNAEMHLWDVTGHNPTYIVECIGCQACGPVRASVRSARIGWNRRVSPNARKSGSVSEWTLINRNRSNLPTSGFVVAGSYRNGKWTTSSLSHGDGYPSWADDDRTHFYRLSGPLPKPPNARPSATGEKIEGGNHE